MRSGIVEGEPGIFPDPVARLLRGIGRLFARRDRDRAEDDTQPTDESKAPPDSD
jgi:hypothetical protein